jgi:hypothetical protein
MRHYAWPAASPIGRGAALQPNRSECWSWQRPGLTLRPRVNIGSIENRARKCQLPRPREVAPLARGADSDRLLTLAATPPRVHIFREAGDQEGGTDLTHETHPCSIFPRPRCVDAAGRLPV